MTFISRGEIFKKTRITQTVIVFKQFKKLAAVKFKKGYFKYKKNYEN